MSAFRAMSNGCDILGFQVKLPFVQNLSKFDVFTIPAAFELLPTKATFRVFDDELKPLDVDLYDPKTWDTYGWNPINDKGFATEFSAAEQKSSGAYFSVVLSRAKRLHEALDAQSVKPGPIPVDVIGSDCKDTLDGVVVTKNKEGEWLDVLKPEGFTNQAGRKITAEEVKQVLFTPGDGIVAKQSLDGTQPQFTCEAHYKMASNPAVQALVLKILSGGK